MPSFLCLYEALPFVPSNLRGVSLSLSGCVPRYPASVSSSRSLLKQIIRGVLQIRAPSSAVARFQHRPGLFLIEYKHEILNMSTFVPIISPIVFASPLATMDPLTQAWSLRTPRSRAKFKTENDCLAGDLSRTTTRASTTTGTSWLAVRSLPSRGLKRVKSSFSQRSETTISEPSALSRMRSNVSEKFSKRWSSRPSFFAKMVRPRGHGLVCFATDLEAVLRNCSHE